MRAPALLAALLSLTAAAQTPRFIRFTSRTDQGRSTRGLLSNSLAFFEAFPASGAGTTTACSTTAPTGAKGEALTFTRTGSATCTRTATGGLATTGIADGDLVSLSGNVARVEYDSAGVLGLLVESSRTNVLLQSATISNAAYTDVGTPTLTGSQTDPFGTTTAVQVEDNDGAAYEGRAQTVTVSAGAAYIMSCFIKAGTSALARLSLDGTACNVSGLSTSTWTRATCADASSSGAAISAQVLVGNATSDTGTVIYGGCQVEAGTYATSYQPATSAAAVRNGEVAQFDLGASAPGANLYSAAVTKWGPPDTSATANSGLWSASPVSFIDASGKGYWLYNGGSVGNERCLTGNDVGTNFTSGAVAGAATTTSVRAVCYADGNSRGIYGGVAMVASAAQSGAFAAARYLNLGNSGGAAAYVRDGVYSRVCISPDSTRCR